MPGHDQRPDCDRNLLVQRTATAARAAALILAALAAVAPTLGLNCTGGGVQCETFPPPQAPSLSMLAYVPDGSNKVEEGFGVNPVGRTKIINNLAKLKSYGFGRLVQMAYNGVARTEEDATAYYAPLIAQADALGIRVVPGLFAWQFIDDIYGIATEPPWNVQGPNAILRHPKNPSAVAEAAYWDDLVIRCRNVARGARSGEVFLDQEFIFYSFRMSDFWSDGTLATIRGLARSAVQTLRCEGIYLIMYHPAVIDTDSSILRIADGIFRPDDFNDPLAAIEHFAPIPYYNNPPFGTRTPAEVEAIYASRGYDAGRVRFGFAGPHIQYGFAPATLDAFFAASPEVVDRSWYVAGNLNFQALADSFGMIAAGP